MYTAEALIHVQNRDAQVVEIEGVVEELIADPATIESEIQLLTSRAFLRRNVEELNLVERSGVQSGAAPGRAEPSFLETLNPLQYLPEDWLASLRRVQETRPDRVPARSRRRSS